MILLNPLPDCNVTSLYLCKQNIALETFLVDKPRKYKYNARPIYDEDFLFILPNISEIEHLQAIGLSLS